MVPYIQQIYLTRNQAAGEARSSFVTTLVEEAEKAGRASEEEEEIIYAAGAVYAGDRLHYQVYNPMLNWS